jgi:hypothetical protein
VTSPPELAAAGPGINSSNGELPRPRAASAKASLAAQLRARRALPASSWRHSQRQSATLAVQVTGSPTPFGSLSAPAFAARRLLSASTVYHGAQRHKEQVLPRKPPQFAGRSDVRLRSFLSVCEHKCVLEYRADTVAASSFRNPQRRAAVVLRFRAEVTVGDGCPIIRRELL